MKQAQLLIEDVHKDKIEQKRRADTLEAAVPKKKRRVRAVATQDDEQIMTHGRHFATMYEPWPNEAIIAEPPKEDDIAPDDTSRYSTQEKQHAALRREARLVVIPRLQQKMNDGSSAHFWAKVSQFTSVCQNRLTGLVYECSTTAAIKYVASAP